MFVFLFAVVQPFVMAQLKRLPMFQAMCCVLDLSNKCFLSILLNCWIYEPCYLSLLMLQGIKIATEYSPSRPGCGVSICHQRVTLHHAVYDLILPWPWNYGSPDEEKRAQKDCCSECAFQITDILSSGMEHVQFWKYIFNLGALMSKMIFCFQKAKKREGNKKIDGFIFTCIFLMSMQPKE